MLTDLVVNLLAALIGFLTARAFARVRELQLRTTVKWFWVPTPSSTVFLHYGASRGFLADIGEREPMVNFQDALTLGELRVFLKPYYLAVVITTDKSRVDWRDPIVTIGGPIPNPIAREIGEQGLLPVWFLDMPYHQESDRVMGTKARTEMFRSEFDDQGNLVSDVGTIARLRSPRSPNQYLYIIAGNYGAGTLGVVTFLTSPKALRQLRKQARTDCFQGIIRARLSDGRITHTELVHCRGLH